jgi:glycosyltransferase involved in cell wall biosynthesis
MKIVIFDGSFKTTTFINRLIHGLANNGVEIYVLGFNEEINHKIKNVNYVGLGSNQSLFSFIKTCLILGFSESLKSGFNALFNILSKDRKKLQKQNLDIVLKQISPDIVHLQWPSLLPWVESQLKDKKYKIILSERGNQINVQPFVDASNFAYLQKCFPYIDGFHSVSEAITKVSNRIYKHPNKFVKVIYTGLDLQKVKFNATVNKHRKIKIISVGRQHWVKGYDIAIRAMHQLKLNKVEFEYQIIGAKNNEELVFLRHDLDLEKEVKLIGKLPQQKVFDLMASSDLLLLPSIEEGIANVVVEAMALGTPVISTDCGGMRELITHEKEGWVVPIRNPKAIAEQIENFTKKNFEEIIAVKLAARKKVEVQHSESKMVEEMLALYVMVSKLSLNKSTTQSWTIKTERNKKPIPINKLNGSKQVKTPIIPTHQTFVKIKGELAELDYKAICLFAATGFFWDDSTYWKNQKVLRPATINTIDQNGYLLDSKSYFKWYYEPNNQSFETSVEQYQALFEQIVDEQIGDKQVILGLSGGLDSRNQAIALHRLGKKVSSYSYSFQGGYKEHEISEQIAKAFAFDFQSFEIQPNELWKYIDELAEINQCYSEFTHPRQMAILKDLKKMNGVFSLGHWGDVLFSKGADKEIQDEDLVKYIQDKVIKKGGLALATTLWESWGLEGDFSTYLNETTLRLLNTIDIKNSSAKVRAFKSKYWAPRWTSINLSVFEAAHPITLPYYDNRMCELICRIPEEHLADRKIQIAYILQNNPAIAKITWQEQKPFNLTNFHKNKAPYNLPYRVADKLKRIFEEQRGKKFIERNWELQFLGKENETQLEAFLFDDDFKHFINPEVVESMYSKFKNENQILYSHPVSMLLTLSKWYRS